MTFKSGIEFPDIVDMSFTFKTESRHMRKIISLFASTLALAACGSAELDLRAPDQTSREKLDLATVANVYCTEGTSFLADYQLCASATEAVGPFTNKMIEACKTAGGGNACYSGRWSLSLAKKLRGTALCAPGSTMNSTYEECVEGEYAFGPFSKATVDHCTAKGGDWTCRSLRIATKFLPVKSTTPNLAVPYFFQYNNGYEPGRTCNLTSLAMVMNFFGKSTTPDTLYRSAGGPIFSGSTLANFARGYGFTATYSERGSKAIIKQHLDQGKPVILQGWFTPSGHFVVVVGYNSTGWIVNDPAGVWNQRAYGSYNSGSSTAGRKVVYGYAAVEAAATDPGNPSSYWITVLSK